MALEQSGLQLVAQGAAQYIADMGRADSANQQFVGGLGSVGEAAAGAESRLGGLASLLGGAALGGVTAIGAAFVGAGAAGLSFNNSMEQARARINAFTKDGEKTEEILAMVAERAAKTPFAFEEMAAAAAGLGPVAKSTGLDLEGLISQAEVLAASNPAEGLEGAVVALKEAASGDFTSAIERFNLSRSYINQLKEEGVPALEALSMAMEQAGYDTDLVSNMANTAEGRWSTFKDTLTTLAGTVTQPIFDTLSGGLGTVNDQLAAAMPQLQGVAQGAADFISAIITSEEPLATLGAKVQELGGQLVAWVQESLPGWTAGLGQMGQALGQWVVENAPAMLAGLMDARAQLVGWVLESVPEWAAQLGQLGQQMGQWVIDALPNLGTNLGEVTALLIGKTGEFIAETTPKLLELAGRFVLWVAEDVLPNLPGALVAVGGAILTAVGNFAAEVAPELGKLAAQFVGWVQEEVLPELPGKLAEIGSAIVSGIAAFISSVGAEAAKVGDAIIDGAAGAVSAGASAIADAARDAAAAALEAAKDFLGIQSPSKVFADEVGRPISQGTARGIIAAIPQAVAAAEELGEEVLKSVTDLGTKAQKALDDAFAAEIGGTYGVIDSLDASIQAQKDAAAAAAELAAGGQDPAEVARLEAVITRAAAAQELLNEARATAVDISAQDPIAGAAFLAKRTEQIGKLLDLQARYDEETDASARALIGEQLRLLEQAQAAELVQLQTGQERRAAELEDLQRQFGDLPADLVGGIVQALQEGIPALSTGLTGALRAALDEARAALEINSPSQVAADLIGAPLMAGVAAGIADAASMPGRVMSTALMGLASEARVSAPAGSLGGGVATYGGDSYSYSFDMRGSTLTEAQAEAAFTRALGARTTRADRLSRIGGGSN